MILYCFLLLLMATGASAAKANGGFCRNEGQQREHESDERKFYKCIDNRWIIQSCQINYFYDHSIGFCVLFTSPTISPPHLVCHPGQRVPDPFDNTRYKECDYDGKGFTWRYCQPGSIFVRSQNMCVDIGTTTYRPTRTTTYRPTTTTTPYYGACREAAGAAGFKPDIYNCQNFYQCASGIWVQKNCPAGTIWSQSILTCDHNRGQCRPHHPTHHPTYPPTYAPSPPTIGPTWNPGNSFKK
ncbi:unnamed protein product [Caenorhabditis brenneri]